MASIKRIDGKTGTSYKITVTKGRDINGKQIRHFRTFTPPAGMTEKQAQKAVQRAAIDFEREIELGYQADNRQTFAEYAEYVLQLKERQGCKHSTTEGFRAISGRIYAAIGHMRLADIRPQHLNRLYADLAKPESSRMNDMAVAVCDFRPLIKAAGHTQKSLAELLKVDARTIGDARRGERVKLSTAKAIASALGKKTEELFRVEPNTKTLSTSSIRHHHVFISIVLAQAVKEMLVPFNAAEKSSPPRVGVSEPNYFQPSEIAAIMAKLDTAPLLWKTLVHIIAVTGCRRGEVAGLKWKKVDLENGTVRIDSALLYSPKLGLYDSTTKTSNVRILRLPEETVELLKAYKREVARLRLMNGDRWKNTDYVFVRDDGSPIAPNSINVWLNRFAKKNGFSHINPHAFRHTAASVLIASGMDVVTVSKQLGHANVGTTENVYAHIIEEQRAKASECIADVILRAGRG